MTHLPMNSVCTKRWSMPKSKAVKSERIGDNHELGSQSLVMSENWKIAVATELFKNSVDHRQTHKDPFVASALIILCFVLSL